MEEALRLSRLTTRDASRLGGQLGFGSTALFGRVVRAYTRVISSHRGGWTDELRYGLRWWNALLTMPLRYYQDHDCKRRNPVAWVDGSWEITSDGALGAVLLTADGGCSLPA